MKAASVDVRAEYARRDGVAGGVGDERVFDRVGARAQVDQSANVVATENDGHAWDSHGSLDVVLCSGSHYTVTIESSL